MLLDLLKKDHVIKHKVKQRIEVITKVNLEDDCEKPIETRFLFGEGDIAHARYALSDILDGFTLVSERTEDITEELCQIEQIKSEQKIRFLRTGCYRKLPSNQIKQKGNN